MNKILEMMENEGPMKKILEMMENIEGGLPLCLEYEPDAKYVWPKRWERLKFYITNYADRTTCPECEQNADSGMNFCAFCGRELWREPIKPKGE